MRVLIALCIAMFIVWYLSEPEPETAQRVLTVDAVGLQSSEGVVRFFIYGSEDLFVADRPTLTGRLPATNQSATWEVPGLPAGNYLVLAYHDANNNGELDKGLFRRSKERFGFSNTERSAVDGRTFKQGQFYLGEADQRVEVFLR